MTTRTIAHVDLDCFFAGAEVARNPSLRGKPLVVGGGPVRTAYPARDARRGGYRGIVCTASYEARAYGIRTAMPLSQAQRLCPHAVFLPVDFHYYEALSRRFHHILRDYTPDIEPLGLEEAFLDLTGCQPLIGTPRRAAHAIRRRVRKELSLTCSVGLASAKVVAKVASHCAKPDGFLAVPPGKEAAFLAPLPIRALPMVGAKVENALLQWGLDTIGDVARMPPQALQSRFGLLGRVIWFHAQGIDPAPLQSGPAAAKSVSREVTFPWDVNDPDLLRATLRLEAERIGAELRSIGKRTRCVTLKLRYGDFITISRSTTLSLPTHADHLIYQAACALLDLALGHDRRAVRLIGLGTTNLVSDAQLSLPDGPYGFASAADRWERLARWIDRVRAKYGYDALQTGRTIFSPQLQRLYVR